MELAAALARQPQTGGAGVVRPPAIVVEYMGQGSLKGALARKADIVQGPLIRVLIAMDAAKVFGCLYCSSQCCLFHGWRLHTALLLCLLVHLWFALHATKLLEECKKHCSELAVLHMCL